jgi:HNH endonuclease
MKTCTKCGDTKPYSEFSKRKSSKDGHQPQCKFCCKKNLQNWVLNNKEKYKLSKDKWRTKNKTREKESMTKYVLKNLEKVKSYQAKWRLENAEKLKKDKATWRLRNAEKIKKGRAEKYLANADKMKEEKRKYYAENAESFKIRTHNRRAKISKSGEKLSQGLACRLFKLQKGKCACCKLPLGDDYHMDHIMPIAFGGENTDSNIQLLRAFCNKQKYAKHPIDFMQERGYLL